MGKLIIISVGKKRRYIVRDFSTVEDGRVFSTDDATALAKVIKETKVPVVFSPSAFETFIDDIHDAVIPRASA